MSQPLRAIRTSRWYKPPIALCHYHYPSSVLSPNPEKYNQENIIRLHKLKLSRSMEKKYHLFLRVPLPEQGVYDVNKNTRTYVQNHRSQLSKQYMLMRPEHVDWDRNQKVGVLEYLAFKARLYSRVQLLKFQENCLKMHKFQNQQRMLYK